MTSQHPADSPNVVLLGRVSGLFGTRGWLKVWSHTRPPGNILTYGCWLIGAPGAWRELKLLAGREQGSSLIVQLEGITDRDVAAGFVGASIAVPRDQLPPPAENEYYWVDLIGMQVVNRAGTVLGEVKGCHETGSADVLEVRGDRAHLIPFVRGVYVDEVDRSARLIRVDWHEED